MKPRLPSVSLTSEDYDIFSYGARAKLTHTYAQLAFHLDRISETQDRRDAEVMLYLTSSRKLHGAPDHFVKCGQAWGLIGTFPRLPSSADMAPL